MLVKKKLFFILDVSFVPVCKNTGMVRPADIIKEITSMTCLVTVMLANNETGVIQPIKSIFEKIREINRKPERPVAILTHTDAAQAFGKIPVSVQDLDVDYMTIVGHKVNNTHRNLKFVADFFFAKKVIV